MIDAPQALTLFLLLRAFTSGTTALTGVEAISNGVPAFHEPRSRNAAVTLVWMAAILGVLLIGITYLSVQIGAVPSEEETIISQLARTIDGGRGILYLLTMAGTTDHPDHGRQHLVRGLPAPGCPAGNRRFPAPPARAAGQPPGLLPRHRRA